MSRAPWIAVAMRKRRDHLRRTARELIRRDKYSPERPTSDREYDLRLARARMREAWAVHQHLKRFRSA